MRRWVGLAAVALLVGVGLLWWLWPSELSTPEERRESATSANEGALPESIKPSSWNAPIQQRGARSLSGVVLRDGQPVGGAVVTAVAAHGDDVLSDLPCKCDNHCGQMLLACGCAEASGQLVELVALRTGESAPLARATTNSEGVFTLTGLEDTTLTLFADAPGGVGWLGNVASDAQDTKLTLTGGRVISGKVLTTDEKPAKGAIVTAIFAAHSRFFDAVADDKGEFRLGPLPIGKYAVVAMQGGLLPDHQQVDADETEPVTLELSVPRALSGVVLANGAPVSAATVKLEGMHRKRTVTTDAKGEFHLERLRPGEYELTAEGSSGVGATSALISKHEDRGGVTIVLGQGEPVEGRVVTDNNAPVEGARVSLRFGKNWRHVDSDARGAFRFAGVGPEEQDLHASKAGMLEVSTTTRGGQSGIELRLAAHAVLYGQVRTSAGEVVPKYSIRATALDGGALRQHNVKQNSVDGGFAIGVWPGLYTLRVDAPPFAPGKLEAAAPGGGLVIVVSPGGKISGVVFDDEDRPAVGARISAALEMDDEDELPDGRSSAETGSDGRFELTGLEGGTWHVDAAMLDEYMPLWHASAKVTLAAAGNAEIVLRPKPGVPFAGVVVSADGEPVEGVKVLGWQKSLDGGYEPGGTARAVTGPQGHFRLRSLHAGPVQLSASHKTLLLEGQLKASAPDENVVLKLSAGTTVSGRLVSTDGKPITAFELLNKPVEAPDGKFKVPVDARITKVAFDAPGYAQLMRKVNLTAGDNPLGEVVMQRGRAVSGVVRDARTRAPITGALVDVGVEPAEEFLLAEKYGATKTDAQGRYVLPAVDSSSSYIFATAPRYVSGSQPLVGNSSDFELHPAISLTVKVVDATNTPVQRAWVVARNTRIVPLRPTSTAGTFESKDMSPGVWTVVAQTGDARTFRPTQVTLTEAPAELVLREATDGVTVEVKLTEASVDMVLVPGTLQSIANLEQLMTGGGALLMDHGVARHVLPGPWTVVFFRVGQSMEAAMQPIEVKASGNPVWTLSPQWQQVDPADLQP
ncbi:MAG: carboxypeptidase regulatory-like domain-containing protein [Archangium sp.]|nr:carboxypeptidase regulatory-like domain-containing protein [Archangium sp.]MDP3575103.1 carboxypeptidase regulatory-like domain-containing protein [Archangium sp.]